MNDKLPSDALIIKYVTDNAGKVDAYDISVKFDIGASDSMIIVDRLCAEGRITTGE